MANMDKRVNLIFFVFQLFGIKQIYLLVKLKSLIVVTGDKFINNIKQIGLILKKMIRDYTIVLMTKAKIRQKGIQRFFHSEPNMAYA